LFAVFFFQPEFNDASFFVATEEKENTGAAQVTEKGH